MTCQTCKTKHFVHAESYCSVCDKMLLVSGDAYLYRIGKDAPLKSAVLNDVPRGKEKLVSAHLLLQEFRIEFIEEETE